MKPKQINIDLDDADPNGVFEDQTLGGAGNFSLDGAGVTGGEWITPDGFAKQIGFESAGNISGVTFTVTGFEDVHRHKAISETLSGPNANTVETTNYFYVITQIAADGAVGTNTEAGPVDEAITATQPVDWRGGVLSHKFTVTGTINYTLEDTFDDIQDNSNYPFTWDDSDDADVVGATANAETAYEGLPRGQRVKINSYSSGAALVWTRTQRDI